MFLLMLCTVHCCADCALLCTQDVYKGSSLAPSSLRELSPSCDSHSVSPSVTICVPHLCPHLCCWSPLFQCSCPQRPSKTSRHFSHLLPPLKISTMTLP